MHVLLQSPFQSLHRTIEKSRNQLSHMAGKEEETKTKNTDLIDFLEKI
jgi:hypothetical protein